MFEDLERLRADGHLLQLLSHYALVGAADRTIWQDRLMNLDGVSPRDLHRLHGELIAFGWVEQNTGVTTILKPGVAAGCYRPTPQGLRAVQAVQAEPQAA
jgi:hypothetical protein